MKSQFTTTFILVVFTVICCCSLTIGKPRKIVINTPNAPKAIGPYSQAIKYGETLYLSGQIGLDPASGQMIPGGIIPQTSRVLQNIEAVLSAGNSTLADVVSCTVLLTDLNDFTTVNNIYAKFFTSSPPARATFQVAALPANALIEIQCIAATNEEN